MPRKKKASSKAKKPASPRCSRCGKTIRVPAGWSTGPAVRRHYWREHRDVMMGDRNGKPSS